MFWLARANTAVDGELGTATVFGGSRGAIASFLAEAGLFVVVLARSAATVGTSRIDPGYYWITALALAIGVGGAGWVWRTRLVVGTSGFRYARPFARRQWLWADVVSVDAQLLGARTRQVVIRVKFDLMRDRQVRLPLFPGFSASPIEVLRTMQDALALSRQANGLDDGLGTGATSNNRTLIADNVVLDPELGPASLVGSGKAWWVTAIIGGGLLLYLLWSLVLSPAGRGRPTDGQTFMIGLGAVVMGAVSLAARSTRLLVGQEGFRYTRPLRRLQVQWERVGPASIEGSGRNLQLVVPMVDDRGRSKKFSPLNVFSSNPAEIRDLMNAARTLKVGDVEGV